MERSTGTSAPDRPRVYLAEDSRSQRRLYAAILGNDFEVVAFENGLALLAAAMRSLPDVVVSDVEMPEMDGLALTRRLKQDPVTRPVPVILLTAGDGLSVTSCLDAGADDFLRKPVQADELAARARSCARAFATYKELQASEARMSAILEGARAGIVTMDPQGRIESVNRSAERLFGWSRAETRPISILDLLSPGPARTTMSDELERLRQGGAIAAERLEVVGRHRSGAEFPVDCSLYSVDTPAGRIVCAFLRDLTASRRMEAALRQAQQLEAIGRMAAGIAHEINTPVQCIQDSLEFLREAVESLPPIVASYRALADAVEAERGGLAERAREAEEGADLDYTLHSAGPAARRALDMARRIAEIVRATKNFAGPEGDGVIAVDLPAALRTILDVSRPDHADVADVELEAEPLSIVCQASAVNDAVRHLIVNAAHAIADTGRRGTIRVRAYLDGSDVVISVADDGCGVAPEHADRIVEPFFTTKPVGRGVGLGLFVASSTARHHGGSLTFESAPGRGSTFWLRLPARPIAAAD